MEFYGDGVPQLYPEWRAGADVVAGEERLVRQKKILAIEGRLDERSQG